MTARNRSKAPVTRPVLLAIAELRARGVTEAEWHPDGSLSRIVLGDLPYVPVTPAPLDPEEEKARKKATMYRHTGGRGPR